MSSEHLPIFKATLDLCVYVDGIVKNQEKYHKYGIDAKIRDTSQQMLYVLISIANAKKRDTESGYLRANGRKV